MVETDSGKVDVCVRTWGFFRLQKSWLFTYGFCYHYCYWKAYVRWLKRRDHTTVSFGWWCNAASNGLNKGKEWAGWDLTAEVLETVYPYAAFSVHKFPDFHLSPPCCLLFIFFHFFSPIIIADKQRKMRRAKVSFGILYWHPSLKPLRFFKPLRVITARITKYKPLNLKAQLFRALCKL